MTHRPIVPQPLCITCGLPITPQTPARRLIEPERSYAVRQHLACARRAATTQRAGGRVANRRISQHLRAQAASRGRGHL